MIGSPTRRTARRRDARAWVASRIMFSDLFWIRRRFIVACSNESGRSNAVGTAWDEGAAGMGLGDRQVAEALGEGPGVGVESPPYPKDFIVLPRREVGGGENLGTDLAQAQDEARLQVPTGDDGGAHLRRDVPTDAQEVGQRGCVRPSHTDQGH